MPLVQGRDDANRTEHATLYVDDRRASPQRLPGGARHVGEATHHLGNFVEGGAVLVRTTQEALLRAVDQPGVSRPENLIAETQAVHGTGAKIFDEDIGIVDQAQYEPAAVIGLKVHAQAALVAVVHGEVTGPGAREAARVVTLDGLDLDDVGAEISKDEARRGPHDHVGEFNNPHPS